MILSLITGVVSLYFIPQTQEYVIDLLLQIQLGTNWLYEELLTLYTLPLWIILVISIFASITIIKFFLSFQTNSKPEYITYIEDFIYETKWRWKWEKDEITNIQCYCPKCDAILVYDDSSTHTKHTDLSKTDFICENCNFQIVTSIRGGNKNYAISAVKREIERRIRTNEYKTTLEKN